MWVSASRSVSLEGVEEPEERRDVEVAERYGELVLSVAHGDRLAADLATDLGDAGLLCSWSQCDSGVLDDH